MAETKLHLPPHTDGLHIWVKTASPLVQKCCRGSCKALLHFQHGKWCVVEPTKQKRTTVDVEQPALF